MAPPDSTTAATTDLLGVSCIILSEVLLASVNVIVKSVPDWSSQQMMVVRYTADFVLCAATSALCRYALPRGGIALRLLLRGCAYVSFIYFFWSSLRSCLPLGDVVVIVIASSPICLVGAARLLLKEEIPAMWPVQVLICLAGAMLVNKPMAVDADCPASTGLLPLGAGLSGAFMNLASRSLKDVPPVTVCLFNDIVAVAFGVIWTLVFTPDKSPMPVAEDWSTVLMVIAAVIGWGGLMANVKGYQSVSVAGVASIAGYISVPLNYALQVFMFGQVPDKWSTLGASLIFGTNVTATLQKLSAMRAAKNNDNGYTKLPDKIEGSNAVEPKEEAYGA